MLFSDLQDPRRTNKGHFFDQKQNEIVAIPEILDLLEIKGCNVTIDAMGCQKGKGSNLHLMIVTGKKS